jgi:hypothetical protein
VARFKDTPIVRAQLFAIATEMQTAAADGRVLATKVRDEMERRHQVIMSTTTCAIYLHRLGFAPRPGCSKGQRRQKAALSSSAA